ncbi:putative aminopeptidase NPEPL1 [Varanus komodoensis]|nr:putative aminopeptidase NPEPL1 [Varanus komodoensis]
MGNQWLLAGSQAIHEKSIGRDISCSFCTEAPAAYITFTTTVKSHNNPSKACGGPSGLPNAALPSSEPPTSFQGFLAAAAARPPTRYRSGLRFPRCRSSPAAVGRRGAGLGGAEVPPPARPPPARLPFAAAAAAGRKMANVQLEFQASAGESDPQSRPLLVLGQLQNLHRLPWAQLRSKLQPRVTEEIWQVALSTLTPNPTDSCPLYLNYATVAALPSRVSRHNSPSAAQFLTRLIRNCLPGGTNRCILMVCERSEVFASACAIARAFPLFTHRSSALRRAEKKTVIVEFFLVGQNNGPVEVETLKCLESATEGVRLAARIVDTPCNEMNTDCFLEEIRKVGKDLGIVPTIFRNAELKEKGFGGIYGVGKAAAHPPALAVLSHTPEGATQTIAWVGKGIVYDTGGLSIKGKLWRLSIASTLPFMRNKVRLKKYRSPPMQHATKLHSGKEGEDQQRKTSRSSFDWENINSVGVLRLAD